MNIVFIGSSEFAVPSLESLLGTRHKLVCVVTQPDKAKGRGMHMANTPVKSLAQAQSLNIFQPQDINSCEGIRFIQNLAPDLIVVVAYGQILDKQILDIPKILTINLHASLLPKYRGAAPINWAIINADKCTGVTVMKVAAKMDAGPIILQKKVEIKDNDSAVTLSEDLAKIGAQALLESIAVIENKSYQLMPQDEKEVTYAPKLKKENGLIDWDKPAEEIYNLIRGCISWPGAFTYYKGRLLKIFKAEILEREILNKVENAGEIIEVSQNCISVACGKDFIVIQQLQLEGKRVMSAQEFIQGHRVKMGERFCKK